MEFVPRPYQKATIEHALKHPGAGIFLPTGLGKTVCALTVASELIYTTGECRKCLVVAPKLVAEEVWSSEAEQWDHLSHLTISKVLGRAPERVKALQTPADIYVISWDNVWWLVKMYGFAWPFDLVILDELSYAKSRKSKRFRALAHIRPFVVRLEGLTATPSSNGHLDLWAQIYLLDQGERLGVSFEDYRKTYFKKTAEDGKYTPRPGATRKIQGRIKDICISMRAKDWMDIKEPLPVVSHVRLSRAAKIAYEDMERDMLLPLASAEITATTAPALGTKLLQVASGCVYDEHGREHEIHTHKLDKLEELIDAANGANVLVFYSFKHELRRIKERFPYARALETVEDIRAWNRGEIPLLVAHPKSAGHGNNLQAGGHMIVWFTCPWSLELYQQGNGRLHRIGQKEQVIIHHIVANGTLDEAVIAALRDKEDSQNALLRAVRARVDYIHSVSRGA